MAGPIERLKAWWESEHKGASQTEVAALLGIEQSLLSRILAGDRSVGLDDAHKIERATDRAVPTEAWIGYGPLLAKKAARERKRRASTKRRRNSEPAMRRSA